MSQTFYVNLFHNGFLKYSGFKKKLEYDERGGSRPVMLPINKFRTAVRFPYRLDSDKNIRKISINGIEVAFLIPTRDVPKLNKEQYKDSIFYNLFGDNSERVEELRDQVSKLKKQKGKLKKEKRELEEEEEENNKGGSSSSRSSGLRCSKCGGTNSESAWQSNNGLCPQCNGTYVDDPEVQRV